MTLHFDPPAHDYPGCRRVVRSGDVEIGAIFPPVTDRGAWHWRLWLIDTPAHAVDGKTPTLEAAQAAIRARWAAFLERAALTDARRRRVDTPEGALANDLLQELTRARAKFPGRNVTFAALVEEVGELATAIFEESSDRVRKEAVQVAVMAMRVILDGDHTYEPWRAEKGLDPLSPDECAALKEADG